MKRSGSGKLAALLMLVCAVAQLAPASAVLASTLARGLSDHAHSVSVVNEGGHLHLVLAHPEGIPHGRERAPHHGHLPGSFSEGDHVFHIMGDDATTSAARRSGFSPVSVVLPGPASWTSLAAVAEPRVRAIGSSRPVVLRL